MNPKCFNDVNGYKLSSALWGLEVSGFSTNFNQVWGWYHFPLLPCGMDPLALRGAHTRSSRGPHFFPLGWWYSAEETHALVWWHPHMFLECHIACRKCAWSWDDIFVHFVSVGILGSKKNNLWIITCGEISTQLTHGSTGGGDGLPGSMPWMGTRLRTSKASANREKNVGNADRRGVLCPQQDQCCCQCMCSPSSLETFSKNSEVQATSPWRPEGRDPHGLWKMWCRTRWKNNLPV